MTTHDSSQPITHPEAFFWSALEQYVITAEQMISNFDRCITNSRNQTEGAAPVGSPVFAFYTDGHKLFSDGLKLAKSFLSQKEQIDAWFYAVGKQQGGARERYLIANLDWTCLMWQFEPNMISVLLPDKSPLEEAVHAVLDQIALGRMLVNRLSYLSGRHVEFDVASFAATRRKAQFSTRDCTLRCTPRPLLFCTVLMSPWNRTKGFEGKGGCVFTLTRRVGCSIIGFWVTCSGRL